MGDKKQPTDEEIRKQIKEAKDVERNKAAIERAKRASSSLRSDSYESRRHRAAMRRAASTADEKTVKRLFELLLPLVESGAITREYAASFASELAAGIGSMSREELRQYGEQVRRATLALPELGKVITGRAGKKN